MRRRRRHNKPKVLRRERPVLIECHGDVPGDDAIVVGLGSELYVFAEDAAGRYVANVFIEDHITCFLARPEMYRALAQP